MDGVDKAHVQRVVYELSKNSDYFRRQQRLDAQTYLRVAELQRRMARSRGKKKPRPASSRPRPCSCRRPSSPVCLAAALRLASAAPAGRSGTPRGARELWLRRTLRLQAQITPREMAELAREVERKAQPPDAPRPETRPPARPAARLTPTPRVPPSQIAQLEAERDFSRTWCHVGALQPLPLALRSHIGTARFSSLTRACARPAFPPSPQTWTLSTARAQSAARRIEMLTARRPP